jgi:predicted kinase
MKGSPGTAKSTIAHELGRRLRWPVIDKDVVRDLLPEELGGLSYEAMLGCAERQLAIGLSVIADSPLGYGRSYAGALAIGQRTGARVLVLACECSDADE